MEYCNKCVYWVDPDKDAPNFEDCCGKEAVALRHFGWAFRMKVTGRYTGCHSDEVTQDKVLSIGKCEEGIAFLEG